MAKLFTESTEHKMLNGTELANRREALGWTQAEFASACGYSQQYQQHLETFGLHEIQTATAEKIMKILQIL